MELLLLLPILWSIRNLLNNCRNVFKSLWVQPKIFEIGVSWVFIIAIHIQLFFSLFLKIYDGLGFLRRKIRCMSLSLAIVICWVWQFWHPFEIVEKLPLWQSDICEMEPSLYPAGGRTANQGRSLLEKWSWFIVKVVERNSWACSPSHQLSIILLTMTMVMTRTTMYEVGAALLLSTIYYPADQLYGPHCCPWEGGNTRHLHHFWKWTEMNVWHFFFCCPSCLWHKCCTRVSRRNIFPKKVCVKAIFVNKKHFYKLEKNGIKSI